MAQFSDETPQKSFFLCRMPKDGRNRRVPNTLEPIKTRVARTCRFAGCGSDVASAGSIFGRMLIWLRRGNAAETVSTHSFSFDRSCTCESDVHLRPIHALKGSFGELTPPKERPKGGASSPNEPKKSCCWHHSILIPEFRGSLCSVATDPEWRSSARRVRKTNGVRRC